MRKLSLVSLNLCYSNTSDHLYVAFSISPQKQTLRPVQNQSIRRAIMTALIHDLPSAWHVDQACMSEDERVVVIRFGDPKDKDTWAQDEMLYKIADKIRNFAVIYTCDNTQIRDFNQMYELYDVCTVMFFWRNKHMMCDFGTGNNNKLNFLINDKQDLIDVVEVIYRGAKKGRGLVVSPKDYSTHYKY